jgi:hypothetical protein
MKREKLRFGVSKMHPQSFYFGYASWPGFGMTEFRRMRGLVIGNKFYYFAFEYRSNV